ncbi:hypothetical protein BG004_006919 [Podila humilis]|nr:hypothetical protein BG004_006919 [Podila humilis]
MRLDQSAALTPGVILHKKNVIISISLPPSTRTRYTDPWPMTINAQEGAGLVIGTQSCNALATSSLCLGLPEQACDQIFLDQ